MPVADHFLELLDANNSPVSPAVKPYFLSMKGPIQFRQERAERLARGGIDGHGFDKTGSRGEPFALSTVVDAPSLQVAKDLYKLTYSLIPHAGLVAVTKDGIDCGWFMVERCQLIGWRACGEMAGGFSPAAVTKLGLPSGYSVSNGPSAALLTIRWTLIG
jgi:hypothetical protein